MTLSHDERGAVLIEAMYGVIGMFLVVLIALDLIRISYLSLAGQYALNEAVRWGAVGTTLPGLTREQSIKETLRARAAELSLSLDSAAVRICRLSLSDPGCANESAGDPDEPYYVKFSYDTKLIFGGMNISLSYLSFGTNEPFTG